MYEGMKGEKGKTGIEKDYREIGSEIEIERKRWRERECVREREERDSEKYEGMKVKEG